MTAADEAALRRSAGEMTNAVCSILSGNSPTVYLYGSAVLDDFRPGWSDIDILVLTDVPIGEQQADKLVGLRRRLTEENDNPYFRLFEGGMLSKEAFFGNRTDTVVYWGTSGQRITDMYKLDSFAAAELVDSGILLCGEDVRSKIKYPTREQFKADIRHHYDAIRQYAQETSRRVTSCGWLLDIARGLYTLRTGKIIAKTAAGEWAIERGLAPDTDVLKKAVEIRKNPIKYASDGDTLEWCGRLGAYIQEFADILEKEL